MTRILSLIGVILVAMMSFAQSDNSSDKKDADKKLVQFSGVVMTSDSLMGIPYVNVVTRRTQIGTYSDLNGYFNFVAQKGDTIDFSCIGFKSSTYVIPDSLSKQKYSMIKLLTVDTLFLDAAVITPLPRREMFDYYFVNADIPDDDMERARKNLERDRLKEQAENLKPDGAESGKYYLTQQARSYYSAGQIAPNNLLNPFAWAQFFEAWKRGDFKKKDRKISGEE